MRHGRHICAPHLLLEAAVGQLVLIELQLLPEVAVRLDLGPQARGKVVGFEQGHRVAEHQVGDDNGARAADPSRTVYDYFPLILKKALSETCQCVTIYGLFFFFGKEIFFPFFSYF